MIERKTIWNTNYQQGATSVLAEVLQDCAHLLPDRGRALDLACGTGVNSLFLASKGLSVEAWDISEVAIEKLQVAAISQSHQLTTRVIDIKSGCLPADRFDVILVTKYLDRGLYSDLEKALAPGGLLFYQTFTQIRVEGTRGPTNPDYLLEPNELIRKFANLTILLFRDEQLVGDNTLGFRNQSYLVAQKPC